jgi:hypothetical protein
MNFRDLLKKKKSAIVRKWFDLMIEDYPPDSSHFLKKQENQFLNPVGYTLSESVDGLFDVLLHSPDPEKFFPFLNDIIKIKAVQDFSPSKAISFIFSLKKAVREELKDEIKRENFSNDLKSFELQIDDLALLSFDIYMKCRERIYQIKTDESRRIMFRLLQKANLVCEIQDQEQDPGAETVLTQNIKG